LWLKKATARWPAFSKQICDQPPTAAKKGFRVGYVEGWFVAESRRSRGFGAALLRAAEDWARGQGCIEMASDTAMDNFLSQHVHEASGLTVCARSVLYKKKL
jgi:aminoglycoside 6'-N-acetyltransferase I